MIRLSKAVQERSIATRKRQKSLARPIALTAVAVVLALSTLGFGLWRSSSFSSSAGSLSSTSPSITAGGQVLANRLQDIAMLSKNEGWAVGGHGTILHFKNGRWERIASPTLSLLTSIEMLSLNEGWIVGENGTILHYRQGKWALEPSPTTQVLYGIGMASANEGWAMGESGIILHYSRGKWSVFESPATEILGVPVMLSANDGWAVGRAGTILHYNGVKWSFVPGPNANAFLSDLSMLSARGRLG